MSTASLRLAFGCIVAVVLSAAPLAAQSITGTIQGAVRDNQGLAVPAATVTLRNVDTNVSRALVTDAEGFYRFLNMPVGNYELSVELSGFSRYVRSGLTLALNQTAVVDQGPMAHASKFALLTHAVTSSRVVHLGTGRPEYYRRVAALADKTWSGGQLTARIDRWLSDAQER